MHDEEQNINVTANTLSSAENAVTNLTLPSVDEVFVDLEIILPRLPICERVAREWTRLGKIPSIRLPGSRRILYHWPSVHAALLRMQRGGPQ